MAIETVWCSVLHGGVTRVTNLEGEVVSIHCPEYIKREAICRLKSMSHRGGPLAQLLEQVSQDTLGRPTIRCDLR
jgi:hypothetical protein